MKRFAATGILASIVFAAMVSKASAWVLAPLVVVGIIAGSAFGGMVLGNAFMSQSAVSSGCYTTTALVNPVTQTWRRVLVCPAR